MFSTPDKVIDTCNGKLYHADTKVHCKNMGMLKLWIRLDEYNIWRYMNVLNI